MTDTTNCPTCGHEAEIVGITNVGHGHVWPRADGAKARCGGPALCRDCAGELPKVARHITPLDCVPAERLADAEAKLSTIREKLTVREAHFAALSELDSSNTDALLVAEKQVEVLVEALQNHRPCCSPKCNELLADSGLAAATERKAKKDVSEVPHDAETGERAKQAVADYATAVQADREAPNVVLNRVCCVSQFVPAEDVRAVVEALKFYADAEILYLGTGDWRTPVDEVVQDNGATARAALDRPAIRKLMEETDGMR